MYVIAGVTGRVGSVTAHSLLDSGAEIRVLVRRPSSPSYWESRGAEVRILRLEDRAALTRALLGCTGFFVLLPFDLTADNLEHHADQLIASISGAVADACVPHVVMLSSGGADLAEGTGPITGLHRLEEALRATGTTVTALRSGHFQDKVADVVDIARGSGIFPVFATSADVPLPMAATADLGALVATSLLQTPPVASESVDVIGPAYSERNVATLLGEALGQELKVTTIPEEAWADTLADAGFPPNVAASLAELYRADEHGLLAPRGDRSVHVHTPVDTTIRRVLARS